MRSPPPPPRPQRNCHHLIPNSIQSMYQQFRPHEEEQKQTIERLMQEAQVDMAVGDTWYLVAIKWWLLWKSHVGLDEGQTTDVDPGFIDNAIDLCDESGLLKPLLMEGVHYHLVPQSVWKALISWYPSQTLIIEMQAL